MLNEFHKVFQRLDFKQHTISSTNCYVDDILVASKGSLDEPKATVNNFLTILNKNNMAVKYGKCAIFQSEKNGSILKAWEMECHRWLVKQTLSKTSQSQKTFGNCDPSPAL